MTRAVLLIVAMAHAVVAAEPLDSFDCKEMSEEACLKAAAAQFTERLSSACEAGDAKACHQIASSMMRSGQEVDYDTVFQLTNFACDQDLQAACNDLSALYAQGLGVRQDLRTAYRLNQMACQTGWLNACTELGQMLIVGQGTGKDPLRGVNLISETCENGDGKACYLMGNMAQGVGESESAVQHYHLGCVAGSFAACEGAAKLLYGNSQVLEASAELEIACDRGNAKACGRAGSLILAAGLQVPELAPHFDRAYKLLEKACSMADPESCAVLTQRQHEDKPVEDQAPGSETPL